MKKFSLALLAAATALAITPLASANPIPLGSFTLGAEVGSTSGSVAGSTGFTAVYSEEVYDYSGGLAFEYTITNSTGGSDLIETTSTGYGAYSNAALELEAIAGDGVSGSYATNAAGTISVNFANGGLGDAGIGASGIDTSTYILFTDATQFGSGKINFIDDSIASDSALVPAPEPSSLLLLGSGLFGLAFVVFRKAKSSGLVLRP
jgi:hypothetical protein